MSAHRVWSRRARLIMGAALVLVAVLGLWQHGRDSRTIWWESSAHVAIVPDGDGIARFNGLEVAVDSVALVESVRTQYGELYEPLDGYQLWTVNLAMNTADSELTGCEIGIEDSLGRIHYVNNAAPSSVVGYSGIVRCDPPDEDEVGEPVGEVQKFFVTIPADAEPRFVRVENRLAMPEYLELPAG